MPGIFWNAKPLARWPATRAATNRKNDKAIENRKEERERAKEDRNERFLGGFAMGKRDGENKKFKDRMAAKSELARERQTNKEFQSRIEYQTDLEQETAKETESKKEAA